MVEKIIEFLKSEFPNGIQIFYTPNIAGDEMVRIFFEDDIEILYAVDYDYIEIFGMDKDDYNEVVRQCSNTRFSAFMMEW